MPERFAAITMGEQGQQQRDGQGGIEQLRQTPEVELHHPDEAEPSLLEPGHVTQKVEGDPEQREATQADAQWQQEFPEQVAVEEAHRTWQPYAGSIRLTNCGLQGFHGAEGAFFWGLCGVGPALAGLVREVMAFALTRDGDWVAAIQCSLRPNPAAAGVWSGYEWFLIEDRLIVNGDLGSGAVVGELQDCFRAALTRVGGLRSFCAHVRVALFVG